MDNPTLWRPASWGGLNVTGDGALGFLQGQLSHDLRGSRPDGYGWSSYSSAKGRVLAVMRVRAIDQGFELLMPHSLVESIAKRLSMFVLRSKVSIALIDPQDASEDSINRDRRTLIENGLPVVYPETQDTWVAQMLNLDSLGGISFDKGCFTGQEVIARLHYLGKLKQRMFHLSGRGAPPLPETAIVLADGDGQSVGEIVDAVEGADGFQASAVLRQTHAGSTSLALRRDRDVQLGAPGSYRYD